MNAIPAPPVVLIHGLWMTPQSWNGWKGRFEARGHTVHTPTWPGMDKPIEELRSDPSPMAGLGVMEIADHLEKFVSSLDQKPIIMGHSFGGLFTQIMLDRGYGIAGVGVDPAPVKGVYALPPSALRSAMPVLGNPFNKNKAIGLTPKQFHYAFGNSLSEEESLAVWEREHIPCPARCLFQVATANFNPKAVNKVDLHKTDRAPLLIFGGTADHIVPPAMSRENYKRQSKEAPVTITGYKEWPGRTHYLVGQPGWEEVADYALDWALDPKPVNER